jgi:uncharacterized membrane protein
MASDVMQILSGAGLAGAAGHRAFLPPLLLGIAHRVGAGDPEPWFRLSERFEWMADTKVLVILSVLTLVEYVAERNPDAPELVTMALKAPKAVSGFLVAAAAMGSVDESLVALSASGLLGTATSLGVDTMRAGVKHAVQQPLSDATHGASDKVMGTAETAWSGVMTYLAWIVPIVAVAAIGVLAAVWFGRKKVAQANRVPCPKCGFARHPDAKVCPGCREVVA